MAIAASAALAVPAFAQQSVCQQNFAVAGRPGTEMVFRSWREFPNLDQQRALKNLRAAMLAEGMNGVSLDAEAGMLTAVDKSKSGRLQTFRVVTRKVGNGTRVDVSFVIEAGQSGDTNAVRSGTCRVIDSANL